ncbi:hypothetical protein PFZ79_002694 [Enterococcus hirae]|nr:hypothetical protein [Enterococcus hirae]
MTTQESYKKYVSKSFICESCPLLKNCTESQKHQKEYIDTIGKTT